MKKFEGLLFCTDLDGTLFADDKTVSNRNLDAIEYFKSQGGLFTFVTGRTPVTAKSVCEIIKPNVPYGSVNGGGIYDAEKQQFLWNLYLPDEVAELIRDIDRQLPEIGIQAQTEKGVYFNKDNDTTILYRATRGLPNLSCRYEDVKEPILKINLLHESEAQMSALIDFLGKHPAAQNFSFIRSEKIIYEILPKGVSKGSVLCKMAELFGINPKKTIAVGDYYNDISMIKAAGLGIAVANAVDEAKNAADYITVSNNEDAIYAIIDGLDKGIFTI